MNCKLLQTISAFMTWYININDPPITANKISSLENENIVVNILGISTECDNKNSIVKDNFKDCKSKHLN